MLQPDEHQHHTIWTPELVEIQMPLAGVARRVMAMLIDQILCSTFIGILVVLFFIFLGIGVRALPNIEPNVVVLLLCLMILGLFLTYFLYFWLFHTFNNGKTLGKMWLGIRLVTDRGGQPNGWTCFIRSLFDLVDSLLFWYTVSTIIILMTEREKRIADFAAGTIVILDR